MLCLHSLSIVYIVLIVSSCACRCSCAHSCCNACVAVRGELGGVGYLLATAKPVGSMQVCMFYGHIPGG